MASKSMMVELNWLKTNQQLELMALLGKTMAEKTIVAFGFIALMLLSGCTSLTEDTDSNEIEEPISTTPSTVSILSLIHI